MVSTAVSMYKGESPEPAADGYNRISAVVALTLLEVIKVYDRPSEFFEEEDTSITMPRRLGLSDVVEVQIQNYKGETKRNRKISDKEFTNLVHLVIKRPDSKSLFFECGRRLANRNKDFWLQFFPRRIASPIAHWRAARQLRLLFGRGIGFFTDVGFDMDGEELLFINSDPSGNACALISGFCSAILSSTMQDQIALDHITCKTRGDSLCRWGFPEKVK